MAKNKLDKRRLNSYLSLAYPESIGFSDDSADENNDTTSGNSSGNNGVNTISDIPQRRGLDDSRGSLAGDTSTLPGAPVTQNVNTPNKLFQNTSGVMPPASFSLPQISSKYNPMLFGGNADINNVARAVLSEKTPTQQETVAAMTPEEKLMASIAATNPTPSGFWKRLLVGATSGAQQVNKDDNLGSAFGKILGTSVARAIPQVDSAMQYQENKARALDRYKLESGAASASLQRTRVNQDIANDKARNDQLLADRQRQARIDAATQADKLEDNKRQEAKLKLDALETMGADDPNRKRAVTELKVKYGIDVGEDYGIEKRKSKDAVTSEDQLRKRAESEITKELGATTEERATGAARNQLQAELKAKMPPDLYAALTDPNASSFKRTETLKLRNEIEDRLYKTNLVYTKSDFEKKVSDRIEQLRGGPTARGKQGVTPKATKGNNKVPPSSKAQSTDARTITFR
jgi:hypothetical protein